MFLQTATSSKSLLFSFSLEEKNKVFSTMTNTLNSNSNVTKPIKFLYSYGGKIIPRQTDGKLRYVGGHTRVLSVDRSVSFSELMIKFSESCGTSMNLKCKLPNEDLDVLVTIKSDEELKNMVEEYEREKKHTKIVAVLYATDSTKKVSSPNSPVSCFDFPSPPKCHKVRAKYSAAAAAATYRFYSPSPMMEYRVASAKHFCHERRPVQFYNVVHRNCSQ